MQVTFQVTLLFKNVNLIGGRGGIHIFLLIIYLALNFYVDCRPKRVMIDVDFDSFHGDIVDLTRNML